MLFVMGATGRTGAAVAKACAASGVRAGTREPTRYDGPGETVRFDLSNETTFAEALTGCDALFVMRPPTETRGEPFARLFAAARDAGVRRLIVSSVLGADRNPLLPHRKMEEAARASGLAWVILRPADYMQNFETVHREAIRDRNEIRVPAGRGRSALIDVSDIGACVAGVLAGGHDGAAQALTGSAALSMDEAAAVFTEVLGRPIAYQPVSLLRFALEERRQRPLSMALVMTALYTAQRLGLADTVTDGVARLTGRPATSLRDYVMREKSVWMR